MKIENVRLCGFERLYNAYVKCYESHMKGFSSGLNSYLSHAMISLELSGISGS